MDITITINTDNDAFLENGTIEVKYILKQLTDRLETGLYMTPGEYNLRDSNGNTVGKLSLVES